MDWRKYEGLKKYKPATPGLRSLINIDRSSLWKGRPAKSQLVKKIATGGRNNLGRITSWHRGLFSDNAQSKVMVAESDDKLSIKLLTGGSSNVMYLVTIDSSLKSKLLFR